MKSLLNNKNIIFVLRLILGGVFIYASIDKIIDATFLTSHPEILEFKLYNSFFIPNPCDVSFETLDDSLDWSTLAELSESESVLEEGMPPAIA